MLVSLEHKRNKSGGPAETAEEYFSRPPEERVRRLARAFGFEHQPRRQPSTRRKPRRASDKS